MAANPPKSTPPFVDRRAPAGSAEASGKLRQLKGMLERPIALATDGGLRVVMVERRKARPDDQTWLLKHLRSELRTRLLAGQNGAAAEMTRHLRVVYKALGAKGWSALENMPSRVLSKALDQTEMLNSVDPSSLMTTLATNLRTAEAAAKTREAREPSTPGADMIESLEVSEVSLEEFDEMQRTWDQQPLPPAKP